MLIAILIKSEYNHKNMADDKTVVDDDEIIDDEGDDQPKKVDADKEIEDDEKNTDKVEEDADIEDDQIPVRSSAAHIIARKNRQIEKLKSKIDKDDESDEDEDFGDDLSPETHKAINRRIQEKIDPIVESVIGKADEDELNTLFSKEPEAKTYEKRIRAYMKHPAYKAVPPAAIYHHLAFESAAKVGAKKKEIADKEAAQLGGGGTSHRSKARKGGLPTAEEIDAMSDDEFQALQNKVKGQE